jgi:hypothetical protein
MIGIGLYPAFMQPLIDSGVTPIMKLLGVA